MASENGGYSPGLAVRALQLLGAWQRVARSHVFPSGGGCSCGLGFDGVGTSELELDLLDYVRQAHAGDPAIRALLDEVAPERGERRGVPGILQAVVAGTLPAASADPLLDDMERAIQSLARLHGAAGA